MTCAIIDHHVKELTFSPPTVVRETGKSSAQEVFKQEVSSPWDGECVKQGGAITQTRKIKKLIKIVF